MKKVSPYHRPPIQRRDTIRHQIIAALETSALSARALSAEIGVGEREVIEHLAHIKRTCDRTRRRFIVTPSFCRTCNFTFRKREKFTKPGRCPVCKSESIAEPLFAIRP